MIPGIVIPKISAVIGRETKSQWQQTFAVSGSFVCLMYFLFACFMSTKIQPFDDRYVEQDESFVEEGTTRPDISKKASKRSSINDTKEPILYNYEILAIKTNWAADDHPNLVDAAMNLCSAEEMSVIQELIKREIERHELETSVIKFSVGRYTEGGGGVSEDTDNLSEDSLTNFQGKNTRKPFEPYESASSSDLNSGTETSNFSFATNIIT